MMRVALLFCCLGAVIGGCSSIERFATKGNAAYCGDLVSGPAFHEGLLPSAARPPTFRLALTLDAEALAARIEDEPVTVGHLSSNDADRGLCSATGEPLFADAALRTIPELDHDPLSLLEFGEGRNYNFFAWVDSTCRGTLLAVVSLLRNDSVEVRLFKPAAFSTAATDPEQRPGFGLFQLHREEAGCDDAR